MLTNAKSDGQCCDQPANRVSDHQKFEKKILIRWRNAAKNVVLICSDRQAKKRTMLQIRNPEPLARFGGMPSTAVSPRDLLASLTSLARRRFGIIVLVFSLTVLCGAIYLYIAPPKFMAQASILIDTRKTQLFQQQSVVGDVTIDSAAVDSQIEVLKSEAIAASVVKALHLTSDPEFVGSKPGVFGALLGYLASTGSPSEADLQQRAEAVFRAGILPKRVTTTYVVDIGFLSLSSRARCSSRKCSRRRIC